MKNLNLIERLLSYSHEKQSLQRFARYAAMLIMLLTLGFGQMWGANYTVYLYTGSFTNWENDGATFQIWDGSANHNMTSLGNHWYSVSWSNDGKSYTGAYIKRCASNWGSEWNSFSASITSSKNVWYVSGYNSGGELKYYIKHPWDGGSWTWQTMTFNSENTFKYTGIYKSSNGANVNQDKGDSNYLTPSNASNVNDKVPAIWTYTPSSNSLRIDPAYTLTVNNDGHGSASGSVSKGIKMSTKYAISASSPSTGYHFNNWTRVSGGTCTFDNASSASTNVTVTGDASATVQANFALNTYTVVYNANDDEYPGTATGSTDNSSHTYSTAKKLTSNGFSRTGYSFAGWATTPTGSVAYSDGQSVTNLSSTQGATVTLYAKWTENMSDVSLVASPTGKGSFTIGGAAATSTTAGVTTTRSVTAVPIAGYSFSGWSITGGATISSTSTNPTTVTGGGAGTAATLTATFEENLVYYDVTFGVGTSYTSLGSLSATNNTASSSITSGDDILSASSITFTASPNTGYKVDGFYSDASCETELQSGTTTTYTIASLDANVTVYVKFIPITYTITYNLNSGTNPGGAPTSFTIESSDVTLPTPTRTGYTFNGWYANPDLSTGGVHTKIASGSTGNKEYWAKWTANTYDITYVDANNVATIATNPSTGSTDATINFTVTLNPGFKGLSVTAVDAGSNTVTVTNPSSNNYRFTMPANDVTVTVSATALPIVYVLKTKHANSSLGDGATGFPSTGQIWAWKLSGSNNFYTTPGDFPGPTASSKATAITDDIIGDEWYRFIPDNISQFDGSTAYHVILTNSGRILDTQSSFIEDGSSQISATHTGTIWVVPHGTDANTAYLYTSYPDMIATPYNVTYNAGDHGDIEILETTITSGNTQTISTERNSTLTATPASGYAFNRWKTTGSVTVADATSATTTVSATGAGGTVTATYFETVNSGWYIKGNPAGDDWGTPTSLPLNRVLPGETNVYYRPVTLPANDQYFRFWHVETGNPQYGASTGNLAVSKDTKYDISKETGKDGNAFKYSAGGTVWVVVDESAKKFWLQDPVEFYSVNFGYGDGCDEFTAKDGDENDLVSGNTYVSGTELTFTQTKKDGYTFVGWNTAADGSGSSLGTGASYTIASLSADVNVYAIYTENKTAITITTDGHGTITTPSPNSSPYSLGVTTTQAINASASDGYHWNTWTVSGTAALVSSAATQSNTVKGNGTDGGTGTVTATFTANTWYVRFNRNGGTTGADMSNEPFTYDAVAKALTTNTYTRSGYTFQGWATTPERANAGTVDYADGATVRNLTSTNNGIFDIYAVWEAIQYTITLEDYDPDSWGTYFWTGECEGTVDHFLVTYGNDYLDCTIDGESQPIKTPYTFNGWYSGQGGAGDEIVSAFGVLATGSTAYTDGTGHWNYAGNPTIYAKWTMTLSGPSYIKAPTGVYISTGSITFTYKSASTSAFTAATRTGYILDGYYTAADGDKVVNADGTLVANVTGWTNSDGEWIYSMSSTPSLYTKWTPITYHIAFDPDNIAKYVNDATGSMETIDATYDEYVTLPANTFTRTDYNFLGWAKGSDSTTYTWMDKSSAVINLARTDDATVTLYAFWQGVSVTVSFNKGAGYSVYPTSTTLHVGETYGQGSGLSEGELPTPSAPSGYVFAGWYTSASGGDLVTKNTQLTVSGDHTLYAHYTKADRVYFKNTLGWENVYVTWDADWNYNSEDKGAGSRGKTQELMTNIYGTDIWYKDIPAAILSSWKEAIAFTEKSMSNYDWFDEGQAVFRRDFDKNTTLFVPMKNDPNKYLKNKHDSKTGTTYYSTATEGDATNGKYKNGYWVKYEDLQAGYTLKGSWDAEWGKDHYIERSTLSDSVFVYTIKGLSANADYWFKLWKLCTTSNTKGSVFSTTTIPITSATAADAAAFNAAAGGTDAKFHTTVAGDYTFKFNFSKTGVVKLTIEYPFKANDYRVVYGWNDGSAHTFASEIIKKSASTNDTISMFIHKVETPVVSRSLTIQKCTAINESGVPTWTAGNTIDLSSITKSGVYNFVIEQPASGEPTGSFWKKYDGNFYIRMDSVEGGWDQYKYHPENIMTYSEYSLTQTLSAPYSHYYCKYVGNSSTDISYTVATDYSPMICPVLEGDATIGVGNKTLYSGKPASVRFTYNEETNGTFRSYLKSAQGAGNTRFLVMHGTDNKLRDKDGNEIAANVGASLAANELLFTDTENWVYEVSIQAKPGAQVSIIARYNDVDRYLVGGDSSWETILGGSGDKAYSMKAVYDFKTNRLMTAWTPLDTVTEALSDAEVLIERHNQDGATVITFGKASAGASAGSISAKRVIGALRFDYSELVGRVASWTTETRAKMMFFVSFPFDVNISDIFGLNSAYREAYIIQKYNGAKRAEKGFFLGDGTTSFWEILPIDSVMHAGQGYVVTMDNDYLNGDKGHVWDNKRSGDHVYLYFPSATSVTINSNAQTINVPAHECKINRTFSGGKLNHKYTDSNWNLMGVPVFRNDTADATAGTAGAIFTPTSEPTDTTAYIEHPELGYFYEWNTSKTYTIRSAVGFVFKPMHSYMVQYAGDVTFKAATPKIVAAVRKARKDENYNIELQVLNNANEMLDHTYVELRENAVDTFALNEDTYTMPDSKAVNVYTFAGTYDVAANVLSIGNHVVPVGVIVNKAGTCTFSMPSNFSGTVTLIDKFAQTRTNLMMEDYEVYLEKGTIDDRFELEINIHNAPTAIDGVGVGQGSLKDGKAHKFIMNDMMYILKDGVLYDARGARVK